MATDRATLTGTLAAAVDEFAATVLRDARLGQGETLEEQGLVQLAAELEHWTPDGLGIRFGRRFQSGAQRQTAHGEAAQPADVLDAGVDVLDVGGAAPVRGAAFGGAQLVVHLPDRGDTFG